MPKEQKVSTARALTMREIVKLLTISAQKQNKNASAEMAQLYYKCLIELMADEIKRNGKFTITNIGTLETKIYGGFRRNTYNVNKKRYEPEIVPESIVLRFIPSDFIKAYLNNRDISLGTKRRNKSLTIKEEKFLKREQAKQKERELERQRKYEELLRSGNEED